MPVACRARTYRSARAPVSTSLRHLRAFLLRAYLWRRRVRARGRDFLPLGRWRSCLHPRTCAGALLLEMMGSVQATDEYARGMMVAVASALLHALLLLPVLLVAFGAPSEAVK